MGGRRGVVITHQLKQHDTMYATVDSVARGVGFPQHLTENQGHKRWRPSNDSSAERERECNKGTKSTRCRIKHTFRVENRVFVADFGERLPCLALFVLRS